ncbi:MAG: hypothetical protein C4532_16795 [Candidatus Abyssobacteria bacterium SURF_17]|uniref:Uncharacterized protein n=1 Tax=Candidatus Abyssobacteria bacterium SURF_17 TaxID=2093361 RepID=A0A419ERD0_9BACT|nr:MAG: hypothetical protein C4532_16795 [Candidatus Abyssubacteria bacterium SURF_17]
MPFSYQLPFPLVYLGLFCLISFAVVPLVVRAFIVMQFRIGKRPLTSEDLIASMSGSIMGVSAS